MLGEVNSMTKVLILPVSLVLKNDQSRTVQAFKDLGVGSVALAWHYIPFGFLDFLRGPSIPSLIEKYRKGELTTAQFRGCIREKFPNINLPDPAFDQAWNAMQVVTDLTRNACEDAQKLMDEGVQVYWIAGTNELHADALQQKLGHLLPGEKYFSHEKHKLGAPLFQDLLAEIREKHSDVTNDDIAYLYTPPMPDPHPNLGWLSWLINPIKKYQHTQAKNYCDSLQCQAETDNGFTLVKFKPKADAVEAKIYKKIHSRFFVDDEQDRDTNSGVESIMIVGRAANERIAKKGENVPSYSVEERKRKKYK